MLFNLELGVRLYYFIVHSCHFISVVYQASRGGSYYDTGVLMTSSAYDYTSAGYETAAGALSLTALSSGNSAASITRKYLNFFPPFLPQHRYDYPVVHRTPDDLITRDPPSP